MSKSDPPLKSAYELAMERLRAEDREAGVGDRKALSAEQKKQIAELRSRSKARLAELEILFEKNLGAAAGDPEKTRELEEHYRTDVRRVESSLESDIERVRRGEAADE